MKVLRKIAAILLGLVLFVSGVLKLMDPVGTGLIVTEYFNFFACGFLQFVSVPFGVALALLESVVGAMLLTGVFRPCARIASAALLGVFTLITLILLIANPNMDCGCFGEAIHLTHLQSYIKNLVLDGLWVLLFIPSAVLPEPRRLKFASFSIAVLSLILFSLYSLLSLPLVDYTSMKPGTELVKPDNPDVDGIQMMMVYEKNGQEGTFSPEVLPDSSWTFVREEPFVRNLPLAMRAEVALPFYDAAGEYRDTLAVSGQVAVVSIYNPGRVGSNAWARVARFVGLCSRSGVLPLILVATDPEEVGSCVKDSSMLPYVYFADRRTLMTLNRSNAGVTLLSDGMIVGKWASRTLPEEESLRLLRTSEPVEAALALKSSGNIKLQAFLLYASAVMLLL